MIEFKNLAFSRGARRLVEGASLQIHPGWKVGLTGANGCGKSSLFALLEGDLHQDAGECRLPPSWRIARVAQETPALARSALDYVLDGDRELRDLEVALVQAEAAHDGIRVGELHSRYAEIDGYSAKARAQILMAGLGFRQSEMERAVSSFSGGWRMRLNLAQALIARADLLLLDEPTNHLDLDAVLWLGEWLRSYPGTMLLVSHDRAFLDACVGHIMHIARENGDDEPAKVRFYTGNYSDFEIQEAERQALLAATSARQAREVAKLERFITRFKAKATKARQAQSRVKALERMERVAPAHQSSPFEFAFPEPALVSDPLLLLEQAEVRYGDTAILREVSMTLRPGERIGLLGPNGAGKSTLIKLLAGSLPAASGTMQDGKGLQIGYFAQHQLEHLREDDSPLVALTRLSPTTREQELRNFLGGFDFRGEKADTPCATFSGGERARLALALLVWQAPNLLLLDEPTNHLDLEMRRALMVALQDYPGAMVLVSHDQALLEATCERFILVDGGKIAEFDGDLGDYRAWLAQRRSQQLDAEKCPTASADKESRKAAREQAAADRQARLVARRPLVKELASIEKKLPGLQSEQILLLQQLENPALYEAARAKELEPLIRRQQELASQLDELEMRWLELSEQLEALPEL